jgi:GT2 family glycosyltransferase
MLLTIVIVSWNTRRLLDECLASLKREIEVTGSKARLSFDFANTEVFVVDNASADGSPDMVASSYPWVRLVTNQENKGFAVANNQVLKIAQGQFVLLLNPDTQIIEGAIATLLDFLAENAKAGVVAPQLLNSDGTVQRSCRAFPSFSAMVVELLGLSRFLPTGSKLRQYKMLDWNHDDERQVDQPEGACLMIKQEVLKDIGFFDEEFFMLFEEVDWCYRAKEAGWQIWFTPKAKVVHHYGQSIKQVKARMILSSHRGLYRFWFKHHRRGSRLVHSAIYSALMLLAYVRILTYQIASCSNRIEQKQ